MNRVELIGRLTSIPDYKMVTGDVKVCNICIAVQRRGADAGADFIDVTAFGKTAEIIARYCQKGSRIGVAGRLNSNTYELSDGSRRKKTSVIADTVDLLGDKKVDNMPDGGAEQEDL